MKNKHMGSLFSCCLDDKDDPEFVHDLYYDKDRDDTLKLVAMELLHDNMLLAQKVQRLKLNQKE
tara:strand:- start:20 stop:211 length:192 start_codon:yes stop_codon:yes gene_type:complete